MCETRIQHTAIGTALDSRCSESRPDARCHQERDEDCTGGSRCTCGTRQCDIDQIRTDDDTRNEEKTNPGDHRRHRIDQVLVTACEADDHRKPHDRAHCLDQTAVRHALGESIQRRHRRPTDTCHQDPCPDQGHAGIVSLDQCINYQTHDDAAGGQHKTYHF